MMDKDNKLIFEALTEAWRPHNRVRAKVYHRGIDGQELDMMLSSFESNLPYYNAKDIMYDEPGTYMWTHLYDPEGTGGDPNETEEHALNWIRDDKDAYLVAFDASKFDESKLYPDPEAEIDAEIYLGPITKDMVIGIWKASMGVKGEQVYPN